MEYLNLGKEGRLYFTEEVRERLRTFLEEKEGVELEETYTHNMLSETFGLYAADGQTTLLLRVFNQERLYLKVATLRNQRQGTWTALYEMLCEVFKGTCISVFIVESVLTPEMKYWCLKHGMHASLCGDDPLDGLGIDYVKRLDNEM